MSYNSPFDRDSGLSPSYRVGTRAIDVDLGLRRYMLQLAASAANKERR